MADDRPSKLITESGWYRLAPKGGWERVADEDAEAEISGGGGFDLVRVEIGEPVTEEPLW